MTNKKTAQMEILGLSIVVVLVLMATVFVVKFIVLKAPIDYRKGYVTKQLATNMVGTFLNTASKDCLGLTMTELLQDCSQSKSLTCDTGEDSCQYAESTASTIFDNTISKWKMNYEFLAYNDEKLPLVKTGKKCNGEKVSSEPWVIPTNSIKIIVKLDICT